MAPLVGGSEHDDDRRYTVGRFVDGLTRWVRGALSDEEPSREDRECEPGSPCYVGDMAHEGDVSEGEGDGRPAKGDVHLVRAVRRAVDQFVKLSGLEPDSLSGLRPENDGWSLLIDVVELERIPMTLSILATYRVDTDRAGHVTSYERLRRFTRDATDY